MKTTPFLALRNFWFAGRDVRVGEVLELTDDQVRELIWISGTIEPVHARDRARIAERPTIEWEIPQEPPKPTRTRIGLLSRGRFDSDEWRKG